MRAKETCKQLGSTCMRGKLCVNKRESFKKTLLFRCKTDLADLEIRKGTIYEAPHFRFSPKITQIVETLAKQKEKECESNTQPDVF